MSKPFSNGVVRFLLICSATVVCAAFYAGSGTTVSSQRVTLATEATPIPIADPVSQASTGMVSGVSYHNDVSPPLRKMKQISLRSDPDNEEPHEANRNPK